MKEVHTLSMYILLLFIIILLAYIAFFSPEKRKRREIERIQKIFNAPTSEPPLFKIDDSRNETHPDEIVSYEYADGKKGRSHRKLAVKIYEMEQNLKQSNFELQGVNDQNS